MKLVTAVSFALSNTIAKRMKPFICFEIYFSDSEYIKEYLNEFADQCCPDKKQLIQQVSLSAPKVARRVESISTNIHAQLIENINCLVSVAWHLMEVKIYDVEQFSIRIRDVDENFNITEEITVTSF